MIRYQFLFFVFLAITIITNAQESIRINQDRLEASIFKLATYGTKENGEGNRVAFSDGDIQGRDYVIGLMKAAGLKVSIDFAGNIIGRRSGSSENKRLISFGSHIDMVPDGGNYDGCVGSMAAIEVVTTLNENAIETRHPLEVIIFSNEEGGVMGSRALAGVLSEEALKVENSTGYSMAQGIARLGGDPKRIDEVVRPKGSMAAFLELHIEQGGLLDLEGTDIGIVEGIVGIKWWDIKVSGFANHAGTTPMDMRKDALLASAKFIIAVNEVTNSMPGKQVGTVGMVQAFPGAPNVIPGKVLMSLEIRDLSEEKISLMFQNMKERAEKIEQESGTKFIFTPIDATAKPALTDQEIQQEIIHAAASQELSYKRMQSGAGHDAQDMALIAPTGMIFVPSKGGISHSPKEFTSAEDMANGANVLLQTILNLDAKLK